MTSRSKLQSGQAIAQAMLAVCLAVAAHAAFPAVLGSRWPFAPFVLAVLASCKWGGRSAGSAATILSAMALYAWYLPAANSFWDEGRLGLGLFIAAGMFVSAQKSVKRPQATPTQQTSSVSPMPMFEYADPSRPRRMAA
jgi:K+-sensing histidine kinase KdpD